MLSLIALILLFRVFFFRPRFGPFMGGWGFRPPMMWHRPPMGGFHHGPHGFHGPHGMGRPHGFF